jgi:hypothetical protein
MSLSSASVRVLDHFGGMEAADSTALLAARILPYGNVSYQLKN